MPISAIDLETLLKCAFPDAEIILDDLAGDNDHYKVKIVSAQFRNKPRVVQHRMVHEAIKDIDLHALAIETRVGE